MLGEMWLIRRGGRGGVRGGRGRGGGLLRGREVGRTRCVRGEGWRFRRRCRGLLLLALLRHVVWERMGEDVVDRGEVDMD